MHDSSNIPARHSLIRWLVIDTRDESPYSRVITATLGSLFNKGVVSPMGSHNNEVWPIIEKGLNTLGVDRSEVNITMSIIDHCIGMHAGYVFIDSEVIKRLIGVNRGQESLYGIVVHQNQSFIFICPRGTVHYSQLEEVLCNVWRIRFKKGNSRCCKNNSWVYLIMYI